MELEEPQSPPPSEATNSNSNPAEQVITNPVLRPCILVFDSLGMEARGKIYQTLREYLQLEYNVRSLNFERYYTYVTTWFNFNFTDP